GWLSTDIVDIVDSARRQSERLYDAVERLSRNVPICISLPTLPIPPVFITPMHQGHYYEWELREIVASLAVSLSRNQYIKFVNSQRLDELSPPSQRFDMKSEISTGFPYRIEHASALAELLGAIVWNPSPLKGVITDLDDTLWAG